MPGVGVRVCGRGAKDGADRRALAGLSRVDFTERLSFGQITVEKNDSVWRME